MTLARRATARAFRRTAIRGCAIVDVAELSTLEPDFAPTLGEILAAAATPASLTKKVFRDGLWVTGTGGSRAKSLPKQGTAVSLVNEKLGGNFPIGSN